MQKISIIGSGGSGKTTLANKLSDKLGIKVYHLNKIWRKNEDEHISQEEFEKIQKDIIDNNDSFIFDGNYNNTLDLRLDASDTIIFLDFPTGANISRSVKKNLTEKNSDNKDPSLDRTDKINVKYIRWLANYNKEERPKILSKLDDLKLKKRIVIINTEAKRDLFLDSVDMDSNKASL
ncbi:MAG: DNA topology modulation protein [Tissierellia bacterium]|nr:DNA topology modulation protein [Tissierellia bacterium]